MTIKAEIRRVVEAAGHKLGPWRHYPKHYNDGPPVPATDIAHCLKCGLRADTWKYKRHGAAGMPRCETATA